MTSQESQLIASVDLVKLMQRLRPDQKLIGREVTGVGVVYRFAGSGSTGQLSVAIGIYADTSTAQTAFKRQSLLLSIGPTKTDRVVGDEVRVWKLADPLSGSVLFRRLNTVVYLSGGLPFAERFEVAEQLDKAFQVKDSDVVHAERVSPPRVVKVGFPETINAGDTVTAEIEVAGIVPSEALFGTKSTNVLITQGEKPMLIFYAPKEAGKQIIELIISTSGNLLSTTTLNLQVTK